MMQFPVHPEKIELTRGNSNDTVKVTGVGEVTILQSPSADSITFSSFFPAATFPGCQTTKPQAPMKYVQKLNGWKDGKRPVKFVSTACGISDYYTIEEFKYYEVGGDVGTIQFTLNLKLYNEVTVRQIELKIENQKATAVVTQTSSTRVDNTTTPKTYTVKSGDCLWNIAKKFYGNGSQYTKIYNANKSVIGSNPNLIRVGQALTIP
jgi:nucleoid-associated protein YgaU